MLNKFVLDTNLVVSRLLFPSSVPGQAVRKALQCGQLLMSDATIAELWNVLNRPKFDRYLTREERKRATLVVLKNAEHVVITRNITACRDPKDNIILELAVNGKADVILTGDKDLLTIGKFPRHPDLDGGAVLILLGRPVDFS